MQEYRSYKYKKLQELKFASQSLPIITITFTVSYTVRKSITLEQILILL